VFRWDFDWLSSGALQEKQGKMLKTCLFVAIGLTKFAAADVPIRGVNLGGWLVMEPWITPNLYLTANEGVPTNDDGSLKVVPHYITREYFQQLSTHNIITEEGGIPRLDSL
jgi:hypothetical protein